MILRIFVGGLYVLVGCLGSASVLQADTDAAQKAYLQDNHLTSAVHIQSLRLEQNGKTLTLYNAVGREEKRQIMQERLILEAALLPETFVRGTEFVLQASRAYDLNLYLKADYLQLDNRQYLHSDPIVDWYIRILPSGDDTLIHAQSPETYVAIPKSLHAHEVIFTYPNAEGGHRLKLRIEPVGKPVTFISRTGLREN